MIGIILLKIDLFARKQVRQRPVPGDEGQISIGALVAHQILARGKHFIQHLSHAPDFVTVALNRRGHFLWVKVREPGGLPEVRALTGHLEMEPLLRVVFLREGGEGDDVFGVVLIHQVFDDGAGFEDGDVCIWVVNCGNAATRDGLGKLFSFFFPGGEMKGNFYRPFGFTSVYGCSLTDFPSR